VGICHVTLLLRQSASITFRERKKIFVSETDRGLDHLSI